MFSFRFIPDGTHIPFVRYQRLAYAISGALVALSLLLLPIMGLNFGIDFRGGILIEVRVPGPSADLGAMRASLGGLGLGEVALLPFADFTAFAQIDAWHWVAVVFCALNTLAAYGAFAEALVHAEASRVSVVLALNPLLTMLVVGGAH